MVVAFSKQQQRSIQDVGVRQAPGRIGHSSPQYKKHFRLLYKYDSSEQPLLERLKIKRKYTKDGSKRSQRKR